MKGRFYPHCTHLKKWWEILKDQKRDGVKAPCDCKSMGFGWNKEKIKSPRAILLFLIKSESKEEILAAETERCIRAAIW